MQMHHIRRTYDLLGQPRQIRPRQQSPPTHAQTGIHHQPRPTTLPIPIPGYVLRIKGQHRHLMPHPRQLAAQIKHRPHHTTIL